MSSSEGQVKEQCALEAIADTLTTNNDMLSATVLRIRQAMNRAKGPMPSSETTATETPSPTPPDTFLGRINEQIGNTKSLLHDLISEADRLEELT